LPTVAAGYSPSMERARIVLKPHEDIRIRGGHPWIYDNEIASVTGNPAPADEVEVLDAHGRSLGCAFFNPASKIRARIYSRTPRSADAAFFEEAIGRALEWRRRSFRDAEQSLRMVFAEADGIPGLIVDSFVGHPEQGESERPHDAKEASGRWLSVQFLSLGVESRKTAILEALQRLLPASGIVERSDAPVRALEGLPASVAVLEGSVPERIVIRENGLHFEVDLVAGQKTGWYLDQRSNRKAAAGLLGARRVQNARVLDAFSNAGGFGLGCAAAGASEVLAIDSSAEAIAALSRNAKRNGLVDRIRCIEANVFDQLRILERAHEHFDLLVLDPPPFARNRASLKAAYRGYKELNLRALRLANEGAQLVTCSCSHWFGHDLLINVLEEASRDSGRLLRIVEERGQDLDHPVVVGYPESRYLTCIVAEIA